MLATPTQRPAVFWPEPRFCLKMGPGWNLKPVKPGLSRSRLTVSGGSAPPFCCGFLAWKIARKFSKLSKMSTPTRPSPSSRELWLRTQLATRLRLRWRSTASSAPANRCWWKMPRPWPKESFSIPVVIISVGSAASSSTRSLSSTSPTPKTIVCSSLPIW